MKIVMSDMAKQNINEIYDYISENSIVYAIKTTQNILLRIRNLKFSPYLGRYIPELSSKYYRELIYKSYRIAYTVDEKNNIVYIHL